jgi:hypothetical protein
MRAALVLLLCGCAPAIIPGRTITPAVVVHAVETAPQEPARLVPPEVLLRTWVRLFGASLPLDADKRARGSDGRKVFDGWNDYLSALGLPDYRNDLPRATGTNALMLATWERIGEALCERGVERELRGKPPIGIGQRVLFAFELPPQPLDRKAFDTRLDVLHRELLGYPLRLAPPSRAERFFALYTDVVARHDSTRLSPTEAGISAVCVALLRHPEASLY